MVDSSAPDLSIIVVNWNTREMLRRCLDSVYCQADGVTAEVIVVDNASSDGSQAMVRARYPEVTLIENSANQGFARANNQAARLARAALLLLLNSDAALRPGALRAIVDCLREHSEVGVVGLQLLNDDLSLQPSGKRFPTLASTVIGLLPLPISLRVAYDRRRNRRDYGRFALVDEVSGAAMVVRTALYRDLGGLDERFYFFGEDIDLCWRARGLGALTAYLPEAQAIHTWGGARARAPRVRQGLLSQRAQLKLLQRHRSSAAAITVRLLLIALTALRLGRNSLRAARRPDPIVHTDAHLYAQELLWLLRSA